MREAHPRIRVLVVEDHHIYRNALVQAMSLDRDIEVVGSCRTPEEAIARIRQVPADVIIANLEWRGDPYGGIKFVHQVLAFAPETKVLVCSMHDDEETVRQAIQAGVAGYLLKDEVDTADVVWAVKAVQHNKPAYSDTVIQIVTRLLREASEGAAIVHPLDKLTVREREILPLLANDLSNAEIAQRLGIAEKTVKTHVSHILHKLGLSSRYQVAGYTRRQGRSRSRPAGRTPKT